MNEIKLSKTQGELYGKVLSNGSWSTVAPGKRFSIATARSLEKLGLVTVQANGRGFVVRNK